MMVSVINFAVNLTANAGGTLLASVIWRWCIEPRL
ncbi:hypothetical protein SAMN05421872_102368 [Nocardioides lianchengensis]|uniref:Uncharacterized protein n=1 Tax=Nocardioides lianchengensis TaxID=1045774 RepID=A0A1G6LVI6_9ACTN|nr:hypothetical protein SAMN05421872_102368 [Nocardioides lianchengensis]